MVLNRGGAPRVTLKSQFQNDVQTLCEADNAYETFLATYGKLVDATKTRDETIMHLIEHRCEKVYIPLILSKPKYKTDNVIEAIARLNPKLDGFDEGQKNEYFENTMRTRQHTTLGFIDIPLASIKNHPERKKEDYTEFICTTMHYNPYIKNDIYRFARFTTFLEILNCWIKEYSVNGKIEDYSYQSYLSLVKDVLPEYQEAALEKLMDVVVLSPKHAIDKPWGVKSFDNTFNVVPYIPYTDMQTYLYRNGEMISYIDSIMTLICRFVVKNNVKMLRYIAKHFPLKGNSRFVEIIRDISSVQYYSGFNKDLFTRQMWEDAKSVKQFLDTYYILEPVRRIVEQDPFITMANKEKAFGADVRPFLDEAYPLHRMAIVKRSMAEIKREWLLYRDAYITQINSVDKFGLTPLAYAILFQNIEAIKFFTSTTPSFAKQAQSIGKTRIDYSVSISVLKDGFTIEDLIKVYGQHEIGRYFETKKEVEARWKTNVIKGYHQTSQTIASIIEHTPSNEFWFLAGSDGMYGAGIYFARTPEETDFKAHQHGIILEADVLLGNPLNIRSHSERGVFADKYGRLPVDLLYHALLSNGYDSVVAIKDERSNAELRRARAGRFMQSGNEYMVYNTEQALFTRVVPRPVGGARMGGTKHSGVVSLPPWLVPVQKGDMAALKKLPTTAYHAHWLLNSTPLMVACARGHMDIVKWLLEEVGVAINAKDSMNRNAIFYAMRGGNKHIVQYLITKGAHLLEKDANGKYAIEYFNTYGLEREIDLAATKRVSVSVGYREVLLKELIRMGDPAMEAVLRFYKNTMRPMSVDMKEKFVTYFSHKMATQVPVRAAAPTVSEPWMGAMPQRKEQAAYGGSGSKKKQ